MKKGELADRLVARTGLSKTAAKDVADGVFETIAEVLTKRLIPLITVPQDVVSAAVRRADRIRRQSRAGGAVAMA